MSGASPASAGPAVVFAPTLLLSDTIEHVGGVDEVHVHPAGQGYWVARMMATLDEPPVLCAPLGGEHAPTLRALLGWLPPGGLVDCPGAANGAYVHDRRGGEREEIARTRSGRLDRHAVDDLVTTTLGWGVGAPVVAVCGTNLDATVEAAVIARLCRDLHESGAIVVVDLSGDELRAAIEGGTDLVKVSHEELVTDGWAMASDDHQCVAVEGIRALRDAGAGDVVVSCGPGGVVAHLADRWWRASTHQLSVVDHRGAGDSMTAALTVSRRRGLSPEDELRLAVAAATLNVARHGLASGEPHAVERLRDHVRVEEFAPG